MMSTSLTLTRAFLKIFLRDRQALFFSLFFPIIFMLVFGFINDGEPDPVEIGVVNPSDAPLALRFIERLENNPMFQLNAGSEEALRQQLVAGEQSLVLILPAQFRDTGNPVDLTVLVDAAQVQELALVMPVLEQGLVAAERELRNTTPLFNLQVEDVQARSQRYIDFLVPGLLAFTLMQLSIAGSGFNIVEYRRKGILKRLFVTPLEPRHFIFGLVLSRSVICLLQIAILLAIAIFVLEVSILGNPLSLLLIIILGTGIFLSLGFCIGSFAKSQQTVMAIGNLVVFPQIFLAGVFYPVDALPALIQPLAAILPLTFVVNALRALIIDGASLLAIGPALLGIAVWLVIGLVLAVRLFKWKEVAA